LDGAIADYNKALEIDPDYYLVINDRGVALENKKDFDGAIRDYTRVIEIQPDYAVAYFNRGNARRSKKDLEGTNYEDSKRVRQLSLISKA
jgi:tetratricopeptide (TPR) repeat protein